MLVCSFLGHETVYDMNIYGNLLNAIEEIVQEADEVDFWFYGLGVALDSKKSFMSKCSDAVYEIKTRYPEKTIQHTQIVWEFLTENAKAALHRHVSDIPTCFVDRVIAPSFPEPEFSDDISNVTNKIQRWIIQQSNHIISYVYTGFFDPINKHYNYAKKSKALIHDVTDSATAAQIYNSYDILDKFECQVVKGQSNGQSLKDLAKQLDIKQSDIKYYTDKARKVLTKRALQRLNLYLARATPKMAVCSIFALPEITYDSLSAFQQAVSYLINKYDDVQFNILAEYCSTGYMLILENLTRSYYGMEITAITHFSEIPVMTKEQRRKAEKPFCPPCGAVQNIDTHSENKDIQVLNAIELLVEKSDYCICNLTGNPNESAIRKLMANSKNTQVLDLSKVPTE